MLLDTARALTSAGCCVIPTRADTSKAPAVDWKKYQQQLPTDDQLVEWFVPGWFDGFGVVCGEVSGGLEMLELEGRAIHLGTDLAKILADNGAADMWAKLCAGYLEQSPSGGYHWLYRVQGGPAKPNTKLASRPSTADELASWKQKERQKAGDIADEAMRDKRLAVIEATPPERVPQVLIETRGEGGYVVVAPSAGRTHETGRAWAMVTGGPGTIPTITSDERDLLYAAASILDAMPVTENALRVSGNQNPDSAHSGELRPGDDYNQRAGWDDILTPAGWKVAHRLGTGYAWIRPGKTHGISATTGQSDDGADRLYVFSTSTTFESGRPYSKFAAYAHLEHGDDMSAAAAELRSKGYGAPLEEARPKLTIVGAPEPPSGPEGSEHPPVVDVTPDTYTLTDDGNALRLVDRHHDVIRYCPQRGQWLRWAGYRWVWDEAETVRELARGVSRDLPTPTRAHITHKAKSLSANSISAMVRLARTDHRVTTHLAALDAHPYQLNTPGGVVDLRTGQLGPSTPAAMHTRSTTVAPDPDHPAPAWLKFLADTFAGDPEVTTYVQRLVGISLIGEVLEQILPFAFGAGANGKTTLLGTIQRIVGLGDTGYAISAPADMLLASATSGHPTDIARLSGARIVITSELEDGQRFAEARVKQLTGRDVLTGRFMRQDFFSFVPTHTLWLLANHQPSVRAGGPAFWRRIALLPFMHTVPVEQRDPHLEDRLVHDEAPAILAWCIAGARDYLAQGLTLPESVRAATTAYERDQDTVARFVDEMCETGPADAPHLRTKVSGIRAEYESWCHSEGEHPVSAKALTQALRSRYEVMSERTSDARWYLGIRVTDLSADHQGAFNNPWWQK